MDTYKEIEENLSPSEISELVALAGIENANYDSTEKSIYKRILA